MNDLKWRKGEYSISTDKRSIRIDEVHNYLVNQSYWARTRAFDHTKTAIENSFCFGVYRRSEQIGFARIVTDFSTFAYLADVYILPDFQGKGLGKWLMETISNHPQLQGFRRWILATRDAHQLYEKSGFTALKNPERWMEKTAPDAY